MAKLLAAPVNCCIYGLRVGTARVENNKEFIFNFCFSISSRRLAFYLYPQSQTYGQRGNCFLFVRRLRGAREQQGIIFNFCFSSSRENRGVLFISVVAPVPSLLERHTDSGRLFFILLEDYEEQGKATVEIFRKVSSRGCVLAKDFAVFGA